MKNEERQRNNKYHCDIGDLPQVDERSQTLTIRHYSKLTHTHTLTISLFPSKDLIVCFFIWFLLTLPSFFINVVSTCHIWRYACDLWDYKEAHLEIMLCIIYIYFSFTLLLLFTKIVSLTLSPFLLESHVPRPVSVFTRFSRRRCTEKLLGYFNPGMYLLYRRNLILFGV